MYRVKHELPEGHREREARPVFPTAVRKPKLEQLISRLLDLLSGAAVADASTPSSSTIRRPRTS